MVLKVFELKEVRSIPEQTDRFIYTEYENKESALRLDNPEMATIRSVDLPIIKMIQFVNGSRFNHDFVIMDEGISSGIYKEHLRLRELGESLVTQQSLSNSYYKMFLSLCDKKFFSRLRYLFSPCRFIKDTEVDYGI